MISATITNGNGYDIASIGQTATVKVLDNDPPTLSLSAISSTISESEEAWFLLSATSESNVSFPVSISVYDYGEFVDESSGVRELTFSENENSLIFSIAIDDDEIDEPNNKFIVRILESSDSSYLVGPKPTTVYRFKSKIMMKISLRWLWIQQ